MSIQDTIAAIATPPGRGGIAIVRVSGPLALQVAQKLTGISPKPRQAYFKKFIFNNELLDEGVLLYFHGPASYTGEDIIEFQGHGGQQAPQAVLTAILSIEGIRMAQPGEFTKRAFLNNKLDLTAAEAVEDLISAGSQSAARAAMSSLDGRFEQHLRLIHDKLTNFRVRLEACLDFPEEHEDFFDSGLATQQLQDLLEQAQHTLSIASEGVKLNEGARLVIIGSPNAGKSSLLNALAGVEKAIVTNIPGTTRDVLSAQIEISGVPVTITDTAGIRDNPSDEIEAIGINKAIAQLKTADLILFMIDGSKQAPQALKTLEKIRQLQILDKQILILISKSDLEQHQQTQELLEQQEFKGLKKIATSTKSNTGLDVFKQTLSEALGILPVEGVFSARRRHVLALEEAIVCIQKALSQLDNQDLVLCAQELMHCQDSLGQITGKVTSDELLGKIFSTFCLGK